MKRIAILTAGGDTPALNATIHGALNYISESQEWVRKSQLGV
jgi:6-phosphofructokinase